MEIKGRQHWMDAFRGIAVLLVIVQHAVTVPAKDGYPAYEGLGVVNDALAPYRVPLLLTLSGLLLDRSLTKGIRVYANGKIRRIAWPLLVWSLVVAAVSPDIWQTPSEWIGARHLWFLVALLFCYVVSVLALRFPVGLLLVIVVLSSYVIPVIVDFKWSFILWYSAFFMLGAWLSPKISKWQDAPTWIVCSLGFVAIGGAILSGSGIPLMAPLRFLIGVAGIVVLLWLGPKLPRMRWAEWVGERSIVFYVVHVPAMLVVLNFIGPGSLSGNALTLLLLIVGAVAGLIFTREIFSWLFVFPQRISK